jgi:hypothetical protein
MGVGFGGSEGVWRGGGADIGRGAIGFGWVCGGGSLDCFDGGSGVSVVGVGRV